MKAVVINENGGPGVLKLQEVGMPQPGPGEARIAVEFAGR